MNKYLEKIAMRADVKHYLGKAVSAVNAKGKGAVKAVANEVNAKRVAERGVDTMANQRHTAITARNVIKEHPALRLNAREPIEHHGGITKHLLNKGPAVSGPATAEEASKAFTAGTGYMQRKGLTSFKRPER